MAVLPLRFWPDPALARPCAPVGAVTDAVRRLAADMLETMYAAPGRGLAAPQVGEGVRLFVMDATWRDGTPAPRVCVDPCIPWRGGLTAIGAEACLSIPGVTARVRRPVTVALRYTDLDGARHELRLTGAEARIAQHEADHLDGIVTLDRVSRAERHALEAARAAGA
jgi:peptide deformylase